jgi:hypothetical protein
MIQAIRFAGLSIVLTLIVAAAFVLPWLFAVAVAG